MEDRMRTQEEMIAAITYKIKEGIADEWNYTDGKMDEPVAKMLELYQAAVDYLPTMGADSFRRHMGLPLVTGGLGAFVVSLKTAKLI